MSEESRAAALIAAKAADEKKATDIVVQHVGPLIGVTDYFVLVSAANPRQIDAVLEEIEDKLREQADMKPFNRELAADRSWSLLDFGNVVIHAFLPDSREYYRLEQLWPEAEIVDVAKECNLKELEYSERIAKIVDMQCAQSE